MVGKHLKYPAKGINNNILDSDWSNDENQTDLIVYLKQGGRVQICLLEVAEEVGMGITIGKIT